MTKINNLNFNKKTKDFTFVIIIIIFVSLCFFILDHKIYTSDYKPSKDIEEFNLRVSASYTDEWYKLFGGSSDDYFTDASTDNSGNIFVSGSKDGNGVIAKFNTFGDLQWNTTLVSNAGSIIVASSGNIYCISTKNIGFNINKLNNSGGIEWTRAWGSSPSDYANDIALDSSENIYITGEAYSPTEGATDILVLKYDKNGNKLWERTWAASTGYDQGFAISIDISNYIYIAGYATGTFLRDGCVAKYNSNGARLDQEILSAFTHDIKGIATDTGFSGETYILGQNDDLSSFLIKLDSSFTPVWNTSLVGDPFEVKCFSDNLYAVTTDIYYNYFTLYQVDTSGVLVRQIQWNFPFCTYNIRGLGVCVDNNENVYVPGEVEYCGADEDAFLIKFGHDTDEDGLTDFSELNVYFTDPLIKDTDSDGLDDYEEVYGSENVNFGNEPTDPNEPDSDSDGLDDYEEVFGSENIDYGNQPTDPNEADSDNDGIDDYEEIHGSENINYGNQPTDPNETDSDNDGIDDNQEINIHNTNPVNSDTDSDDLKDGEEINIYSTNPLDRDTDSDGLPDGLEVNFHNTNPLSGDTDSDTMPDRWEVENYLNPLVNDTMLDPDSDDLSNILEHQHNTDPQNPDTDLDGWTDGDEVLVYDTDPLDPSDHPLPPPITNLGYYILIIVIAATVLILLFLRKRKSHF